MLGHKDLRTTQHYAKIVDRKISDNMKMWREKLDANEKREKHLLILIINKKIIDDIKMLKEKLDATRNIRVLNGINSWPNLDETYKDNR